MKMFFVSFTLIMAVGLTNKAPDEPDNVNGKTKESFKKEFAGARFVQWKEAEDYQMAKFEFMGHRVSAYFDSDGMLIGSARNIYFNQLPLSVIRSFGKLFTECVCVMIHEIFNEEGTFYLLTLEAKNKLFHVKADSYGELFEVE